MITISYAIVVLRREGLIPATAQAARRTRRNLNNWIARGLIHARRQFHTRINLENGRSEPDPNWWEWLIDEQELLAAWREGRIPPKTGRPKGGNVRPQKWDSVQITESDGSQWSGQVVQDGSTKSLIETNGPELGVRERLWVDNDRITVIQHRDERRL